MKFKKVFLTLAVVLVMSYSFPALGRQSGYYVIPPELQGIITTSFLDSLRAKLASQPKAFLHIDYERLGNLMWYGGAGVKWSPNDPNKISATIYSCAENGWIKSESQFDTSSKTEDYEIHTPIYDVLGSGFWTEDIAMYVVDTNEIIIITPVDVEVEIYKAYTFSPPIMRFFVEGTGMEQNFQVNLESGGAYIVVFINNEKNVVNIKRIGG